MATLRREPGAIHPARRIVPAALVVALGVVLLHASSCNSSSKRRRPAILSVVPNTGDVAGGETVVIVTRGFGRSLEKQTPSVFFGADAATVVSVPSKSLVEVTTPAHTGAGGPVDVVVESWNGRRIATLVDGYTYTSTPTCSIASLTPPVGDLAGGTPVQIDGSGFPSGSAVTFDGLPAMSVTWVSASRIDVVTPTGLAPGLVDVVVSDVVTGVTCTLVDGYEYVTIPPPPMCLVDSVCPSVGSAVGGDTITITGFAFEPGVRVFFGGIESPVVSFLSGNQITAESPPGGFGPVDVRVLNPSGIECTVVDGFVYDPLLPVLDFLEPNDTEGTCSSAGIPYSQTGLNIHDSSDEDWLCFSLGHSATVIVTVTPGANAANIDVELYDTTSSSLLGGAYQPSGTEVLTVNVSFGFYAVRVYGACGGLGLYDITIVE